jgi:hypothetical protein
LPASKPIIDLVGAWSEQFSDTREGYDGIAW